MRVYVNNKEIGEFEPPCTIPILETGEVEIEMYGGIKRNGSSNGRVLYPFLNTFKSRYKLIPAHTDTAVPKFSYKDNTQFVWIEGFENNSLSLRVSGYNNTLDSLYISNSPADVEGLAIGNNFNVARADFPPGNQKLEYRSIQDFNLPRGQAVYLEFDYKSDIPVEVGFYPTIGQNSTFGVSIVQYFPNSKWRRAYVDLSADINSPEYKNAQFGIFFSALQGVQSTGGKFLIDNIKLVHF